MPTNYTAVWSAVAASFSALAAFLVMLIERRNLMESVRPELIPLDWTREEPGGTASIHEIVTFRKIRNVGRGAAFNVSISKKRTLKEGDYSPTVIIPGFSTAVIAPNESLDVDVRIGVAWKNIKSKGDASHKFTFIEMTISFSDARDVRHFTEYTVLAVSPPEAMTDEDLAPGLSCALSELTRLPRMCHVSLKRDPLRRCCP